MSVSTQTKLDFVYKKALNRDMKNTGSQWFGESAGGGFLIPDTKLWVQAYLIPATPPGTTNTIVEVYTGSGNMLPLTEASTIAANRCWTGSTTDLIPPLFGDNYAMRLFTDSAGTDEINISSATYLSNIDYERSIVWFESAQASLPTTIYARCYKYVGKKGFSTTAVYSTLSFAVNGALTVGTDKAPWLILPTALTVQQVMLSAKTAPTGQSLIINVRTSGSNGNWTSIFADANRPTIAAGKITGSSGAVATGSLAQWDLLRIDIDQVGSTVAGSNLTVEVIATQSLTF